MKTKINFELEAEREFLKFRKAQVSGSEKDAFAIFLAGMTSGIRVAKKVYTGQDPYEWPEEK